MENGRMVRADLVTGVVLLALAVAVIAGAWNMDRLEIRRIHPLSAPGLTPGLLGIALGVASLILIAQSVRSGGLAGWRDWERRPLPPAIRLAVAFALCIGYALGLVGRMPFWLATALFVTTFIVAFEWADDGRRAARLAWAAAIGIAAGLGISYVFSDLFLVRLP
jgi:putative tricarboxylic transport membrane protein